MSDERNFDVVPDPDFCDSRSSKGSGLSVETYTSLSAIWLANILAVTCCILHFISEVLICKPWHVPDFILALICSPYGGVLLRKWWNGRNK